MKIDGRSIADEILESVRMNRAGGYVVRAITVSPTPATRSYLRIKTKAAEKAGMELHVVELSEDSTTEQVIDAVGEPGADAVIVQLPLPAHLDEQKILNAIPVEKDADVLSSAARSQNKVLPPVAAAVREILTRSGINPAGMNAAVIGEGKLVGAPVAAYLKSSGAQVESFNEDTFTPETLNDADLIVSGAGVPGLVQPHMLKEGVVLIDAGTSEKGGVLVGDIDPACETLATVFTPVPGGVGPMAVACLFENVLELRKTNIEVH